MSDTAIFIICSTDELPGNGQLPGDLRTLRNLTSNDERVVHLEVISEAPLPEKTANSLHSAGALMTVLPAAADSSSALIGGVMARLHEFICAYAHVTHFILAGTDTDRLVTPCSFLQRAGYFVTVAGPERGRMDGLRLVTDDLSVWSGRQGGRDNNREDNNSKLDPYEVLVDEVTRGREKGQKVLLTSLKQRMRRRMRRFDETRMKDQDGRPMRKFKDFIADAANRELIQLIEAGNRSHVLLPGEEIPEENDEEENEIEENTSRKSRGTKQKNGDNDEGISESDPLLETVEMVEGESSEAPAEIADLPELTEDDFDVEKVNEDASAPPQDFVAMLEEMITDKGMTLSEILAGLAAKKEKEELSATNREIKSMLQNAFYNELLEPVNEDTPSKYVIVDDWKGIIDFL